MGLLETYPVAEIMARGSIRREDVAWLRAAWLDDGTIDAAEAAKLIALHHACPVQDPSWPLLLVEAVTEHIVEQAAPEGYVNSVNARWLLSQIAPEGRIATKAGLDLVVNVLDKARWSPLSLARLAMEQVLLAVTCGQGPLRADGSAPAGSITPTEVELLRRILYSFASDGHVAVTRTEAEVLLAIDEAVAAAPPNAEWLDLFVKAIANVALSASGYAISSREQALAQTAALDQPERQMPGGAFQRALLSSSYGDVIAAYRQQSSEERALQRLERQRVEIITGETIIGDEVDWLAGRLRRDGTIPLGTAALMTFLGRELHRLHPALAAEIAGRAAAVAA